MSRFTFQEQYKNKISTGATNKLPSVVSVCSSRRLRRPGRVGWRLWHRWLAPPSRPAGLPQECPLSRPSNVFDAMPISAIWSNQNIWEGGQGGRPLSPPTPLPSPSRPSSPSSLLERRALSARKNFSFSLPPFLPPLSLLPPPLLPPPSPSLLPPPLLPPPPPLHPPPIPSYPVRPLIYVQQLTASSLASYDIHLNSRTLHVTQCNPHLDWIIQPLVLMNRDWILTVDCVSKSANLATTN